jgi:hypothetical protein
LEGDIVIDEEGTDVFRKMTHSKGEKQIGEQLMRQPLNHVVKIYKVDKDYIDMEVLSTDMSGQNLRAVKESMRKVKDALQNQGIMYIDWKLDNIGISREDKQCKLFDWNASGIVDLETGNWIIQPPVFFWSYRQAIEHGQKTPWEIDNYAFDLEFSHPRYA